ncbi:hypothetical protein [Gulosibacter chungangensis]|uniref:Uncharacterized protein n=1 Tax=Gulosibacter chungangensis TaxID=979746 RepID=A0A7J5BI99_9MICO|nr:hypothetical protein [Gulosibacter chungangensis]KAB1645169.1 hypothetical protein F8O05_02630 [Gulosibacter chungangensis]
MNGGQIQVDTASFGPASERMSELGDGIASLEGTLSEQSWYPADAWRTAAVVKLLQASGEASLMELGLAGLAGMAHGLASHLLQAQQWYEEVDATVVSAFSELSDQVTTAIVVGVAQGGLFAAGALAGTLMTPGGLALVVAGTLAYHGLEDAGLMVGADDLASWLGENQHSLANPMMVLLVRTLTSGGDEIIGEAVSGVAGVAGGAVLGPLGAIAAQALIRQSLSSPQAAAGAISDVIQRVQGARDYKIEHAEREPVATPESIGDLMQSIPKTTPDGTHVTVTEYLTPEGETVYVVSVAGTSSTGFGGENPMDNLSNLAAFAGQDDETIGATIAAMEQAGVAPGDAVVFAGYSQGALVAAALAGSEQWQTQSVLLAGSPIHGNEIGGSIPVVQLEHSGDLITGLQGIVPPAAGEVAVVHRDPYPNGVPQDQGILGPHMMHTYQDTAALYDAHEDAASVANRDAVLDPLAGAEPVATHDFHLQREYPDSTEAATSGAPSGTKTPVSSEPIMSKLLPDFGDLADGVGENPIGFLGIDEALGGKPEGPAMPDAFQVEVPRPGR